jgi:hypothetical protein
MARKPRTPKPEAKETNQFLEALKFVQLVLHDKGAPIETHMRLQNKTVVGFNGIIGAGAFIQEEILAAPNAKLIVEALSKCGQNLSITQLDNNRISIKSDKFKAIVPCIDVNSIPSIMPDSPIAVLDDKLKKAIEAVGVLANEDAQQIVAASILIRSGSTVATNGAIIFEAWHGIDLPTLALPKAFVQPITKTQKQLQSFGFSESTATFWFNDQSWIRTQLFKEQWPEVDHLLNRPAKFFDIPKGFWEGLDAITPFSTDGLVYFDDGVIKTKDDGQGASYEVAGIPKGPIFNIKNLMTMKPHAKQIDFVAQGVHSNTTMLMFVGDAIRGAMLGRM